VTFAARKCACGSMVLHLFVQRFPRYARQTLHTQLQSTALPKAKSGGTLAAIRQPHKLKY
jgi:hypothetical protein